MEHVRTWAETIAAVMLAALAAAVFFHAGAETSIPRNRTNNDQSLLTVAAELSPWQAAAKKVIEDRGEPTGRKADVETPGQLRHYNDRRRFLATQVAEWKEHKVGTPTDFVGLAQMIRNGELVEVPSVTESHILYGVGASAGDGPFTHYDKSRGKQVPLLDDAGLAAELARIDEATNKFSAELVAFRNEFRALDKRARSARVAKQKQINAVERSLKDEREAKKLFDLFYSDEKSRHELASQREIIANLAKGFSDQTYDLDNPDSRKNMKIRLLSYLRPEALAVMKEVANSYHDKFDRPLPITSLVRPDEYQRDLSKTNANATRIDRPPHSTGLAFDIWYRHMTAEEQEHVMSHLAQLRDEGRIEALRENRDHFHVFAFIDGKRPAEALIRGMLDRAVVTKAKAKATTASSGKPRSEKRRQSQAQSKKRAVRVTRRRSR